MGQNLNKGQSNLTKGDSTRWAVVCKINLGAIFYHIRCKVGLRGAFRNPILGKVRS